MARKKKAQIISDDINENTDEDISYFEEDVKPEGNRVSLFSFEEPKDINTEKMQSTDKSFRSSSSDSASYANGQYTDEDKMLNNKNTETADDLSKNEIDAPYNLVADYDSLSHSSKKILDNIDTKISFGSVPPIDGECANVKRSYSLRHSTVIKIDKIKNAHMDANVSVSTIVDMAISHYFECIFLK